MEGDHADTTEVVTFSRKGVQYPGAVVKLDARTLLLLVQAFGRATMFTDSKSDVWLVCDELARLGYPAAHRLKQLAT